MVSLKDTYRREGVLIADYASRMGDALVRRRAEVTVRAARAEAELAIKARSEFLANMNHELRTPLNAIIGFATMLRDSGQFDLDEEQRSDYAEFILQSADLLLGHINTILEVAAFESGAVELQHGAVELGAIVNASIERIRIRSDAEGIEVTRRDEGTEIFGWGDAERTGQVVDHLMQTAVKACGEGGRIMVRVCTDQNGWSEIAVRDNGAGLTPEEITESLGAFDQVHRGLDKSFSGPGVGYAIAKAFAEMQGGKFSITSRKGQGTLVQISLPPAEEPVGKTSATATNPDQQSPSGHPELEKSHDAA